MLRFLNRAIIRRMAISLLSIQAGGVCAATVVPNDNPSVPMAAVLQHVSDTVDRIQLSAKASGHQFSQTLTQMDQRQAGYPIIGFRPNRTYTINVSMFSGGQLVETLDNQTFVSPPLPMDSREWPTVTYTDADEESKEPGFVFASIRRNSMTRPFRMTKAQRRFTEEWGLIAAFDEEGEVVWYYRSPVRTAGIDRLANGNLFFHTAYFQSIEIDLLGNKIREFQPESNPRSQVSQEDALLIKGIQTLHHQPHQLPNGNFLAFSSNEKLIEDYYTSEYDENAPRKTQRVNGDTVIEFTPEGQIVWQWSAFDHLPITRIGYHLTDPYWWVRGFKGNLDWTHGNGISYDAKDDSVIIYLKHQDAAFKISRKTGEIVWIFGDTTDWPEVLQSKLLMKSGDFRWPYHAHNPRLTPTGNYVLYENGQFGTRPFSGIEPITPNEGFSRAVEYRIDENAMTVEQVWASHTEKSGDTCFAPGMGDVHVLPHTGNALVFDPVCFDQETYELTDDQRDFSKRHNSELNHTARIREYQRTNDSRWVREWRFSDKYSVSQWQIYGGFHSVSLYGELEVSH